MMMTDDRYRLERWNTRQDLLLRAVANRLYQTARQRRFELLDKGATVISLLLSAVVFTKVSEVLAVQIGSALIAVACLLSLAFGWGDKARDAGKRSAEWTFLESTIQAAGVHDFKDEDLAAWAAAAARTEVGEAKQNRALWARSYTKACEVLKLEPAKPFSAFLRKRPALFVP